MTPTQAGHYSELHVFEIRVPTDDPDVARRSDVVDGRAAGRGAVLSMALCVMVLIASEFMPVSTVSAVLLCAAALLASKASRAAAASEPQRLN